MVLEQMVAHHRLPDLEQDYCQQAFSIIYLMEHMEIVVVLEVALVVILLRDKLLQEVLVEDKRIKEELEPMAHLEAAAAVMTMGVGIVINLVMAAVLIFMVEEIMA